MKNLFLTLILIDAIVSCMPRKTEVKPNIIFLLTDDQRYDALGAMGNEVIQTPNLDKLAAEGVVFSNGFVTTSICCASRASLFSGQYARRHGIKDFVTSFEGQEKAFGDIKKIVHQLKDSISIRPIILEDSGL